MGVALFVYVGVAVRVGEVVAVGVKVEQTWSPVTTTLSTWHALKVAGAEEVAWIPTKMSDCIEIVTAPPVKGVQMIPSVDV